MFEPSNQTVCTLATDPNAGVVGIVDGVTSDKTEELLMSGESCSFSLREQTNLIFYTLKWLLFEMCNDYIVTMILEDFYGFGKKIRQNPKERFPVDFVIELEDATISTNLYPTNTRHRYPWIASLRSKEKRPRHYCALTLLSRPPAPTVLVGPAHCTYLCKSSRGEVDNCCCGGPNDCAENILRCGSNPRIVEMTGQDAEILFGEWETGDAPPESSGEKYNIILSINEIKRHPNYSVNKLSGYLQNDIAIFKVDIGSLPKSTTMMLGIFPACLPFQQRRTNIGIHSGWSSPVPFHILTQYAPGFTKIYREFFNQAQYKMEIMDRCKDANLLTTFGTPAEFPTNTYYPPGTVCARSIYKSTCFFSGVSGSPLMIRDTDSGKIYTEGFLSFIKGCSLLAVGYFSGYSGGQSVLFQETEKPSVYTKLSCFLPWIAEEYDMDYNEEIEDNNQECSVGSGDVNDVNTEKCQCLCPDESDCIFPFYYDGQRYNDCSFLEYQGFLVQGPIYRCPVRNITRKIDGINSFTPSDFIKQINGIGFCVEEGQDPDNLTSDLDPDRECNFFERTFFAIEPCKDNCKGRVDFPVVSGGAALLAGSLVSGTTVSSLVPSALTVLLGATFVGGNMVAQNMCLGPLYCLARTGQCCTVIIRNGRALCPLSC